MTLASQEVAPAERTPSCGGSTRCPCPEDARLAQVAQHRAAVLCEHHVAGTHVAVLQAGGRGDGIWDRAVPFRLPFPAPSLRRRVLP